VGNAVVGASGNGVAGISVVARGVPARFVNPDAKREEYEKKVEGGSGNGSGSATGYVSLGQAFRNAPSTSTPNAPTQSTNAASGMAAGQQGVLTHGAVATPTGVVEGKS